MFEYLGDMAQLVERLVRNEEATSSNLVISTKSKPKTNYFFCEWKRFRFFVLLRYSDGGFTGRFAKWNSGERPVPLGFELTFYLS